LLIGVLAVASALPLRSLLADPSRRVRRAAWALLLAPYVTPVLITGYAYANFSLSLIHHPALNAMLYSALLWLKFTPIAAVILHFTPSPISKEAIHCRRLAGADSRPGDLIFFLRTGSASGCIAAFAVVFLCAFSEFEMASLMVVKSWTVALFDAHAGGLALGESLRRMAAPLLCQAAAIAAAVVVLSRRKIDPAPPAAGGRFGRRIAWCHLTVAAVFVLLIPAGMVLGGALRALGFLGNDFVLGREILASLLFAAGASLLAGLAGFRLGRAAAGRRPGSVAVCRG
jgi:hypothetical protein